MYENIGRILFNRKNEAFKIIGVVDDEFYLIEFQDEFKHVRKMRRDKLSLRSVANPFHRGTSGIGYIGIGPYSSTGLGKEAYAVWCKIFQRVGNTKVPKLHTYVDCSVNVVWDCFQNFAEWFYTNPYYQPGWHVDKDMAIIGNRVYGPETCCFLPRELNGFQTSRIAKDTGLPRRVHKNYNKYYFIIAIDGKNELHCGYTNPEDASIGYQAAKIEEAKRLAIRYEGKVDPRVIYNLNNFRVVDNAS